MPKGDVAGGVRPGPIELAAHNDALAGDRDIGNPGRPAAQENPSVQWMPGAIPNRNTVGLDSGDGIETTRDNEFIAGANNRLNFNIAKRQFDPGVIKPAKVLPPCEIVARAAN